MSRPRSRRLLLLTSLLWAALAASATAETVLVNANSLSLRVKPDTGTRRIRWLQTHEPVEVKLRKGEWAQVETLGGETGWVLANYLTETPFVTVDHSKLNVRAGPSTNYDIVMRVVRHYPLRVLDTADGWLKVVDYDGDRGWVSGNLVSFEPWVITKLEKCNVRQTPGVDGDADIVFTTERGVLLKVLEEKDGWLRVRHADGDEGWISAKIVFGWRDEMP